MKLTDIFNCNYHLGTGLVLKRDWNLKFFNYTTPNLKKKFTKSKLSTITLK